MKKLVTLLTLIASFMVVTVTYSYIEAKPAKRTTTTRRTTTTKRTATTNKNTTTSTTTSTDKPFKGCWCGDNVEINIDLYNPKYDSYNYKADTYGYMAYYFPMRIDKHTITKVISIDGNTAIIESNCEFYDDLQRGILTYNPTTRKMSYKSTVFEYECSCTEIKNLSSKRR